jgi:hypothetical protein
MAKLEQWRYNIYLLFNGFFAGKFGSKRHFAAGRRLYFSWN